MSLRYGIQHDRDLVKTKPTWKENVFTFALLAIAAFTIWTNRDSQRVEPYQTIEVSSK